MVVWGVKRGFSSSGYVVGWRVRRGREDLEWVIVCFMSEMADTNLEEFWMSREPESLGSSTSPVALQQWVSQQCRGLAEGMKSIHNYQYKQVPSDEPGGAPEPRHGFHGDIKPANIFVCNSWIGHKSELGILPSHGLVVCHSVGVDTHTHTGRQKLEVTSRRS